MCPSTIHWTAVYANGKNVRMLQQQKKVPNKYCFLINSLVIEVEQSHC